MNIDITRILEWFWLLMCSLWFRRNKTWPLRLAVLGDVEATFLYPTRRCHVEVIGEFHPRTSPIILKTIQLEIRGQDNRQVALSSYGWEEYEQLDTTVKRKVMFIYDDFTDNQEGRLIVEANDNECKSRWFLIKLLNKKDDLPPLDTFEGQVREIQL
ncbi:hypothetical protein ES703_34407 [subsurface metagenome]